MPLQYFLEMHCEVCSRVQPYEVTDKRVVRKWARANGWIITINDECFCTKGCQEEFNRRPEEDK